MLGCIIDMEFFGGLIIAFVFLLLYSLIKIMNFKLLKIYFICIELFIVWLTISYFINNEELDFGILILLIGIQCGFIYFIKVDYKKDQLYKTIYLKISKSPVIPIIVLGVNDIKTNEIKNYEDRLDELFVIKGKMKRKAFCFIEFEDGYIDFHGLFLKQSDMYLLTEEKEFLEMNREELGKGGAVDIKIKC